MFKSPTFSNRRSAGMRQRFSFAVAQASLLADKMSALLFSRKIRTLRAKILFACSFVFLFALLSCEKHKDPFSASNSNPALSVFKFKPNIGLPDFRLSTRGDSLKFKPGQGYRLALQYVDAESNKGNRKLRAHFRFITGSGKITSNRFSNPSSDGLSFDVPAQLDTLAEVYLTPDNAELVGLQLQITDGVKLSETRITSTTFFENLAPVVRFSPPQPNDNEPPYQMDFDASASKDRDGEIETYTWNFGDGEPSETTNAVTITHVYKVSGTFTVRLKIKDIEGATDSLDRTVTTSNAAPVAALSVTPVSGKAPLTVVYNARGSRDSDGMIASYDVSFGDGQSSQADSGSHQYTRDGDYSVILRVRDNIGAIGVASRAIEVRTPPVPMLTVSPDSGAFPLTVTLDGSASQDTQGGPLQYEIFIDGSSAYMQPTVTHIFDSPNTYRIRLLVTNSRNLTAETEKTVKAVNLPPIAKFKWTRVLGRVIFTSESTEPNAPNDVITNYRWNFGDGSAEVSHPDSSMVHHLYNNVGVYNVRLTVTDAFNLNGTKTDTVGVR